MRDRLPAAYFPVPRGLPPEATDIVAQQPALEADSLLWDATRRFGELYEVARIEWLEETITRIEEEMPD